jgi:adenosyl cobinamide kinase/adenosyl cobinamide phosphate guanylyltransferase
VEEPLELEKALRGTAAGTTVVVDCLTLWVANLLAAGHDDDAAVVSAGAVAALCAARPGRVVVVSNEVGSGIVPTDSFLSRRFRDLLGRVNIAFADRAGNAFLVVAGRLLPLLPAETVLK